MAAFKIIRLTWSTLDLWPDNLQIRTNNNNVLTSVIIRLYVTWGVREGAAPCSPSVWWQTRSDPPATRWSASTSPNIYLHEGNTVNQRVWNDLWRTRRSRRRMIWRLLLSLPVCRLSTVELTGRKPRKGGGRERGMGRSQILRRRERLVL